LSSLPCGKKNAYYTGHVFSIFPQTIFITFIDKTWRKCGWEFIQCCRELALHEQGPAPQNKNKTKHQQEEK
jgi:hypothetical protein